MPMTAVLKRTNSVGHKKKKSNQLTLKKIVNAKK